MTFDLQQWLEARSTDVKKVGAELVYTHPAGRTSVLVLREVWVDDALPPRSEYLSLLYDKYLGASIGDGQIIIGSPIEGGIRVSHGYRIPDLYEIEWHSRNLGMRIDESRTVFMIEANWMLLYAVEETDEGEVLVRFDSDFKCETVVQGIGDVFDDWRTLVRNEAAIDGKGTLQKPRGEEGALSEDNVGRSSDSVQRDDVVSEDTNLTFDF